jgi:hypothetical protein
MHLLPPLRAEDSRMPRRCHERVRVVKHARATCCPVKSEAQTIIMRTNLLGGPESDFDILVQRLKQDQ